MLKLIKFEFNLKVLTLSSSLIFSLFRLKKFKLLNFNILMHINIKGDKFFITYKQKKLVDIFGYSDVYTSNFAYWVQSAMVIRAIRCKSGNRT